jgi:hypothetical protein
VGWNQLPNPPEPPKFVGDPERIKQAVQAGRTYETLLKGGFDAQVEDKDWGSKQITNMAFFFEMLVARTIETNDGKRIVELRDFKEVRAAKLLCAADVTIDLDLPDTPSLDAVEWLPPQSGIAAIAAKPLAEAILGEGAQAAIDEPTTKAKMQVDSLSGKKVRVTYVDGVGVASLEPVDCSLSTADRDFIFHTAILSDCHIVPDGKIESGQTWEVDGSQLAGYLDPSLRGVCSGSVVLTCNADREEGGKRYADLHMQRRFLAIDSLDASARRFGSFAPRGTLQYNVTDGLVEKVRLKGVLLIEHIPGHHLLCETVFHTEPRLEIQYFCKIR